ncbi:MAG: twin-arginine translocation signal domain-containing protein [Planctomycetia bacterium]|nr:twin-arginine translocation signal domain-containing protein [Planctomycetia bacterium]
MPFSIDRRRFLEQCGLLAVGAAGGLLLPGWFVASERADAQDKPPLHDAEEQLKKLKLELPAVQKSSNPLAPAVRAGDLLFVSGHVPGPIDGKPSVGKLGQDVDVKQGQAAARDIALRTLGVVRAELGSLNKVVRLVKVLGMVNCTPDFKQQPAVINGFSELMIEVFGEQAGKGARSAVGMAGLPGGVPVEIESIFQVKSA